MLFKNFCRMVLVSAALAWSLGTWAQEAENAPNTEGEPKVLGVIELRQIANEAYREKDYARYRQAVAGLLQKRPFNASYMAQYVIASALLEDRSGAYNMMVRMQQQGLAWDFNQNPDSEFIRGTEVYDQINDLMVRAGSPVGEAEALFTLPEEVILPTSIDWDPHRKALLVGNASDGAVFSVGLDGTTTELLRANEDNGLWAIFGLSVDAENNRLWVSSSASQVFKGFDSIDAGRSGLFEFELDSLEFIKRYPVPVDGRPHRLGDLAQAPNGDIYAIDTLLPLIYRLKAGSDRLQPFMAAPDLVSLRGVTVSGDGNRVYVADHELGITVIDLVSKEARVLEHQPNLNLGGIEGLLNWNDHLVIIQNANKPQRVMRLALDDSGKKVTEIAPLAVAQPFFDYPNFGTLVNGDLYFLANSHWVRTLTEPVPIQVAKTSVAETPILISPDLQKFWDDYNAEHGTNIQPQPGGSAEKE